MAEKNIALEPFEKKVARTNFRVEFCFDENSKIDIRERMLRVLRQSIEDDLMKMNMLS